MNSDRTVQNRLFDIAWVILLVSQLLTLTGWYALSESGIKVALYKAATGAVCLLCAAVIVINIIKKVYPLKTFICYIVFAVISAVSWYFNRSTLLIVTVLVFMSAYEISSRRAVTISAVITAAVIFLTAAFSEIGIIENYLFSEESSRPRYGIGFSWATNGPTLLFFFILQYIYLRKAKMKIWEYIILQAVNVYMFIRTDTNLPFILITFILIFFAVQGAFRNHWRALKHLKVLYWLMPLFVCVLTICIYMAVDLQSETVTGAWYKVNDLLNNRLIYGREGILGNGITLFGQQIEWVGNTITDDGLRGAYNYVDCSYLKILIDCGIFYLAAAIAVYTRMIVRAVWKADFWLVFIVIFILIHSFTEPRLMDLSFNIIPVLAFMKLGEEPLEYKKHSLKTIFAGGDA